MDYLAIWGDNPNNYQTVSYQEVRSIMAAYKAFDQLTVEDQVHVTLLGW